MFTLVGKLALAGNVNCRSVLKLAPAVATENVPLTAVAATLTAGSSCARQAAMSVLTLASAKHHEPLLKPRWQVGVSCKTSVVQCPAVASMRCTRMRSIAVVVRQARNCRPPLLPPAPAAPAPLAPAAAPAAPELPPLAEPLLPRLPPAAPLLPPLAAPPVLLAPAPPLPLAPAVDVPPAPAPPCSLCPGFPARPPLLPSGEPPAPASAAPVPPAAAPADPPPLPLLAPPHAKQTRHVPTTTQLRIRDRVIILKPTLRLLLGSKSARRTADGW